ncbi:MAG TPA: hypothetical protein PKX44_01125, partial [Methanomassiliicoccaceae archaeon]|nr:hypothetical protein [Methanomassiliicoccaceae archaeon]
PAELCVAARIPAFRDGALPANAFNAAAAAALALALDVPEEAIRAGLYGFRGDFTDNPGRYNLWRGRRGTVLLDRADSPADVRLLAEAVRRYAGLKRGQDIPFPVPRGTGRCRAGRGTVESTICELGRDKGDFTARDLSEILEIDGDDLDELIEELLAAGIMYETGPGTYRLS